MVYKGPSEGCRPCRKRKVKCPGEKPFCRHCVRRKAIRACVYDNPGTSVASGQMMILTPQSSRSSQSSYFVDEQCEYAPDASHEVALMPKTAPVSIFEIIPALSPDQDDQALCFFNAFYVRGPREPRTNIWAEEIMPQLSRLAPDSVLALSSTAVATQMLNKERGSIVRSPVALKSYLAAVALLRSMLDSDLELYYDQILPSIFMLEIFETIGNIVGESEHTAIHQNAGMRTVQRAMKLNLKITQSTRKVASALQSRYVWTCFATGTPAPLFAFEDHAYPGSCGEMDIYGAAISTIVHERDVLLTGLTAHPAQSQTPPPESDSASGAQASIFALLLRTIRLLDDLKAYYDRLPLSWRAHRVPVTSPDFHPSIRTAGVYGSHCDVYSSLPTSHANALYRVVRVAALQTRWLLEQQLAALSTAKPASFNSNADTYDTDADALGHGVDCQLEVQSLVDDICAAVPFHLGNRGGPPTPSGSSKVSSGMGDSHSVQGTMHPRRSPVDVTTGLAHYPPPSMRLRNLAHFVDQHGNTTSMTDAAHASEASTKGGFMILTPLSLLLSAFHRGARVASAIQPQDQPNPFVLRDGQMEWIQSQLVRAATVQIRPLTG